MKPPKVGQRVRCKQSDWGDAGMNLPVGATGAVLDVIPNPNKEDEMNPTITVQLDSPYAERTDDGCWSFYRGCEPPYQPNTIEAFYRHFEIV